MESEPQKPMAPALNSTELPSQQNHRFVVLDSCRGICACLVALFHFSSTSHIYGRAFLQGAYLFVDFFFVLSGFVIFASYQEKLKKGFGLGRFLLLRFGRLYPLHLTLLIAFIGADLLKLVPSLGSYSAYKPFTAPGETPPYIISNLLMIHSLGIHDRLSFNDQSWSISVEFYTYVFFAVALIALRDRIKWLIVALLILSPLFLAVFSPQYMNTTFQYGFVRCLFGFSAGALCWLLFEQYNTLAARKLSWPRLWDGIEIILVVLVIVFVTIAGSSALTLAVPLLFSLTVLAFAMERGVVSRFLKNPLFMFLGLLSYSIYMNHMFIKRKLFFSGAMVLNKLFHVSLITTVNGEERIGTSPWQGDLLTLVYLAVLIGASYITFHTIEEPCRKWFKSVVRSQRRRTARFQRQLAVD
jgi:peptidoglycan/LPS O-acetylase OafA/YrhL